MAVGGCRRQAGPARGRTMTTRTGSTTPLARLHRRGTASSTLILDAKHSVVAMSRNSPLGAETVNGDGFGLAGIRRRGPAAIVAFAASSRRGTTRICARSRTRCEPAVLHALRAAGGRRSSRRTVIRSATTTGSSCTTAHLAVRPVKRDLTFAVDPSLYPGDPWHHRLRVLFHLALTFGLTADPIRRGDAIRVERRGTRPA
jgi:glutamine amidotransferase